LLFSLVQGIIRGPVYLPSIQARKTENNLFNF
jgi:hypothetical protein